MMKKVILPVVCALASTSALAGLEFVAYENNSGADHLINATNLEFISNTNNLTLYISSGLDRRLRVSINTGNSTVFSTTTTVVNISDRLTIDDKQFYGKTVIASNITTDSDYTLLIETLDLSGNVVGSEQHEFVRDTIAPVIHDTDITWIRGGYHLGSINVFGDEMATKELRLNNITDSNSGLLRAEYFVESDTFNRITTPASLNIDSTGKGNVTIQAKQAANRSLYPQGRYRIGFDLFDKAGNKATIQRYSHLDSTCPRDIQVQVFNAASNLWEPYIRDMLIHANPVKMRWSRLASNFQLSDDIPYGWAKTDQVSYSDDTYKYLEKTFPYPQDYTYFNLYIASGLNCKTDYLRNYHFSLAPGVNKAPVFQSLKHRTNLPDAGGDGRWVNSDRVQHNRPYQVTHTRATAEPRPFRQKAWLNGQPACYIEPGETYCDSTTNISYSTGRGYSPIPMYISNADGTMQIHSTYLYTYWDYNSPEIKSVTHNMSDKKIKLHTLDSDTVSDWRESMWRVSKAEIHHVNVSSATSGTINSSGHVMNDTNNRIDTFDVSKLPDGQYQITAKVTDTYGNIATKRAADLTIDNSPPLIKISYLAEIGMPDLIADIRDIVINIEDMSSASLISARLHGSNSSENVFLGLLNTAENQFQVERPRIFPTLIDGERYGLELIATDVYGNKTVNNVSFKYIPDNLITMQVQPYLPLAVNLKNSSDEPIASIYSTAPLQIEGGMLATGPQDATITNRSDSAFAISLETSTGQVTVEPGETKDIVIDLGDTGSELSVDVYPAEVGKSGFSELMFDIQSLRSKWN